MSYFPQYFKKEDKAREIESYLLSEFTDIEYLFNAPIPTRLTESLDTTLIQDSGSALERMTDFGKHLHDFVDEEILGGIGTIISTGEFHTSEGRLKKDGLLLEKIFQHTRTRYIRRASGDVEFVNFLTSNLARTIQGHGGPTTMDESPRPVKDQFPLVSELKELIFRLESEHSSFVMQQALSPIKKEIEEDPEGLEQFILDTPPHTATFSLWSWVALTLSNHLRTGNFHIGRGELNRNGKKMYALFQTGVNRLSKMDGDKFWDDLSADTEGAIRELG